jgi:hypothetical protein
MLQKEIRRETNDLTRIKKQSQISMAVKSPDDFSYSRYLTATT